MESYGPTIDALLRTFFDQTLAGTTGVTRQRIVRCESSLRDCVEAEGDRILIEQDLRLAEQEREFEPVGAVARIGGAEDLVFVLPLYLEQPWLAPDLLDRRAQLLRTEQLVAWMIRTRLVDEEPLICQLLDIRGALNRGGRELRQARAAKKAG